MKKTITINVGCYPFIINDDAYEALNQYLNSVHQYFQNTESYAEITGDIEGRLAEIFLEKLGSRQILELSDIHAAIEMMGKPEDFGAAASGESTASEGPENTDYRTGKRLFRDPEDRVLGGVCSGIAAFFGISDPLVIRLLFVVLVFVFGLSAVFYFVLWIAMPKAVSSSDRLAMRGEPVNVSNIAKIVEEEISKLSDSIQGNKANEDKRAAANENRSSFRRIVGNVFTFFGELLRQIVEVLGILIKPIMAFFGILGIIFLAAIWVALVVALAYGRGFINNFFGHETKLAYLAGFNVFFMAATVIALLGMFLLRLFFNSRFSRKWYPLLGGFFLLNFISLALAGAGVLTNFSSNSSYVGETLDINIPSDTLNLKLIRTSEDKSVEWRENLPDFSYQGVKMYVKKADGNTFRLVKSISSYGSSLEDAEGNASKLNFTPELMGNELKISERIDLNGQPFRAQTVSLTLYVPEGKFLSGDNYFFDNFLTFSAEEGSFCEDASQGFQIYLMQESGQLICMNALSEGLKTRTLDNADFSNLKISGIEDIEIIQSNQFAVKLMSRDIALSKISVLQSAETLVIRNETDSNEYGRHSDRNNVKLSIYMPILEMLDTEGDGKLDISGFNQPKMTLNLFGRQDADILANVNDLHLDIEKANVHLQGNGRKMDARVQQNGLLQARQYTLQDANISLRSGAQARIYATGTVAIKGEVENLEISGGATLRRRGGQEL